MCLFHFGLRLLSSEWVGVFGLVSMGFWVVEMKIGDF